MAQDRMPPSSTLGILSRFLKNLVGPDMATLHPDMVGTAPVVAPFGFQVATDVKLWCLPVGHARARRRLMELDAAVSDISDDLRMPAVMADDRLTEWSPIYAWLVDHPEKKILIDTGQNLESSNDAFFADIPFALRRLGPRLGLYENGPRTALDSQLRRAGYAMGDIDELVYTHIHPDHVGNHDAIAAGTPVLVDERETTNTAKSGRMPQKLPRDGSVRFIAYEQTDLAGFERAHALTRRGDMLLVETPGHTIGHVSAILRAGETWIVLAGDAAYTEAHLGGRIRPGGTEVMAQQMQSYDALETLRAATGAMLLCSHDPGNRARLEAAYPALDTAG